MSINWKARLKSKVFWVTMAPTLAMIVYAVLNACGVPLEVTAIEGALEYIIIGVFGALGALGIINDPTTEGVTDSALALSYDQPKNEDMETDLQTLGNHYTGDRSDIEGVAEEEE